MRHYDSELIRESMQTFYMTPISKYRNLKVLSVSSGNSCSGIVPYVIKKESMSCKKAILLTEVGDISQYFMDEREVFSAESENISSIVSKLSRITENKKLSDQVATKGYNWMIGNLAYIGQAPRIKEFLSKVIKL